MRYIFAGNREVGLAVLRELMGSGYPPSALLVPDEVDGALEEMVAISGLPPSLVFRGRPDVIPELPARLRSLEPDYAFGIHYPYILSQSMIDVPSRGFLNLHPAYLPFNKGWHTPSWSILEGTPAGATLHFMTQELDAGDIIHQRTLEVFEEDTAHTLYQRLLQLETQVFREALEWLIAGAVPRHSQLSEGTMHKRAELLDPRLAELHLTESYQLRELIDRLRALTTNRPSEACYYWIGGRRYRITVAIEPDEIN